MMESSAEVNAGSVIDARGSMEREQDSTSRYWEEQLMGSMID